MGGCIRVVVKLNGFTTCMTRGTNALPYVVRDERFFTDNPGQLQRYIDQWEMNKKHPDSYDHGVEEVSFSPEGYGIVVFDADTKVIYSLQSFCSFDYFFNYHLDEPILNYLFDNKRISNPVTLHKYKDLSVSMESDLMDVDIYELGIEGLKRLDSEGWRLRNVTINLDPWVLNKYEENSKGHTQLKKDLTKAGFVIDKAAWKEYKVN